MGCCGSNQKIVNRLILPPVNLTPSILIEENFKLIDYTNKTQNMKDLSTLRSHLNSYDMTDVRCVKKQSEGPEVHSSLIVISSILTDSKDIQEIW